MSLPHSLHARVAVLKPTLEEMDEYVKPPAHPEDADSVKHGARLLAGDEQCS